MVHIRVKRVSSFGHRQSTLGAYLWGASSSGSLQKRALDIWGVGAFCADLCVKSAQGYALEDCAGLLLFSRSAAPHFLTECYTHSPTRLLSLLSTHSILTSILAYHSSRTLISTHQHHPSTHPPNVTHPFTPASLFHSPSGV